MKKERESRLAPWQERLHEIIFEADTVEGKWFDIILLLVILASVFIVMMETIDRYNEQFGILFHYGEWVFTILFTIEYIIRLMVVKRPLNYALSFFGVIDLLSIIPTYLNVFNLGAKGLMVIRALRLLRVFRIFKLSSFINESEFIVTALKHSRAKIMVFITFILIFVCIFGSVMYLIEGADNPDFDNIPRSIYWAIVTLTTVGYGDIAPSTPFGQFLASIIMLMGYAIIAVPTGIVTAEAVRVKSLATPQHLEAAQSCKVCMHEDHEADAIYCKMCGSKL